MTEAGTRAATTKKDKLSIPRREESMYVRKTVSLSEIIFYILFFVASLALFFTGFNGEPFALALLFASLFVVQRPIVCCVLYALSSLASFSCDLLPLYAVQGAILFVSVLVSERTEKKTLFPFLALSVALATFVFFAPFSPYALPPSLRAFSDSRIQKAVLSSIILLLASIFSVALKAIVRKLLRCRLKTEEIVFCAVLYVVVGLGVCRAASVSVYTGLAFFLLLLYSCATKDAEAIVCAFVLSVPTAIAGTPTFEEFFVYGLLASLLMKAGRTVGVTGVLSAYFLFGSKNGLFSLGAEPLLFELLSVLVPCVLFLAIPPAAVRRLENKILLYREKHLPRVAINRNRAAVGEKLFEISGVFREIQATFSSLGSGEAEAGAREYIYGVVTEEVCKRCPQYKNCGRRGREDSLLKLVELGSVKGKVSLVDLPKELADICIDQSGVLYCVNRQLGDYRRYMLETENARDGRILLANQAQGVSEILKNLALEQSEPMEMRPEKEKKLDTAFLKAGIVCSEILVTGEDDSPCLSLVSFGKADVKKIARIASYVLETNMIISEKLPIGKDKNCCILRKKPVFDAAFGVATKTKSGERVSGDTHSIVRIDERRFMLALSDGMGSGEYARKISESTASLLESFYRAKMPSELVLSTINKLITFSKEETFACVDIAVVDLDSGQADIVKIGSPIGFILSNDCLKVLDGASLPLGILESLHPNTSSYRLQENDVLLFLSDGITSAYSSSSDLYEALKQVSATNPQLLADTVLSGALELYGGEAKDDMTAIAVRLFKSVS